MRRAEQGHHHHIAGRYPLLRYAQEASWREDHRRISNGEQAQHGFRSGNEARAVCGFLWVLAKTRP
jgi:hypothetical protein